MFCSEFLLVRKTEALAVCNDVMELAQITFELPDLADEAAWQRLEARGTDIFDSRASLEQRVDERMVRTVNLPQFLSVLIIRRRSISEQGSLARVSLLDDVMPTTCPTGAASVRKFDLLHN